MSIDRKWLILEDISFYAMYDIQIYNYFTISKHIWSKRIQFLNRIRILVTRDRIRVNMLLILLLGTKLTIFEEYIIYLYISIYLFIICLSTHISSTYLSYNTYLSLYIYTYIISVYYIYIHNVSVYINIYIYNLFTNLLSTMCLSFLKHLFIYHLHIHLSIISL